MDDPTEANYQQTRRAHWDGVARSLRTWHGWGGAYLRRLVEIYSFLIPPGSRVLEIGCGTGDLLAGVKPRVGVGIDFSPEMVALARERHPELTFIEADAHALTLGGQTFDAIILSDTINDLWDVQKALEQIAPYCTPATRIILNYYSRLWEFPLAVAQALKLAKPNLRQNWLDVPDVHNLLYLAGFEPIRTWEEVLFPLPIPVLAPFLNRFVVRWFPFNLLALTHLTLARPRPLAMRGTQPAPTVSVIVPARNEAGNIRAIFEQVPEIGAGTELIFVEGHSSDNTTSVIEECLKEFPQRKASLFHQTGKGKGDAVRLGFAEASGDILMILDADLTVPPSDLPRFFEALTSGRGEFINGVRLIYPMEKNAMRFFNYLGNKFFSSVFTWLLGQPVKDTLCGTKVLWKRDYETIAANRRYFGDFDPFGDYDLLFGAAKLNLKIVDLPIRYRERTYGSTNIQRWKHGWLLLRMVWFAARRLKFV